MTSLPPYPQYKPSGIEWLGDIPSHWDMVRNQALLKERNERSIAGAETLLSVSQYTGVTPCRIGDEADQGRAASLEGYKVVHRNDFVVNIMLAWNGSFGTSLFDGLVSPAYCVYRVLSRAEPRFVEYLLRTPAYLEAIKQESTGVVDSRLRLYTDKLYRLYSPLPPLDEQRAIADFLDRKDAEITRFIASRRRMIALLEEKKQTIFNQAVTRGLDPTVPMKDGGVEWLGEIPAHWEVRRLKQVCDVIVDCKNRTPEPVAGGGYTVVRTTNIRNGNFQSEGSFTTDAKNYQIWTQRGAPRVGDVFFTREAPAGEACLVPDKSNLCMGQRMMYFRPDPDQLDPRFLLRSICGPLVSSYVEHSTNGSTVGHLRLGQVSAIPVLWCPLEEQCSIAELLNDVDEIISRHQLRMQREIELVNEYRTRLISDVVTGKVRVV